MFNTRADVDRHVQNCMKKITNEAERNLRCLAFGKLYLAVGEYEQARRYVSTYLSVKPHSAEAQLVLGESLEKLGKNDGALDAYRSSLEMNPKQNNLLIKICQLLSLDDVKLDQSYVKYYCDRALTVEPHNPIVFNLKEKLISTSSKDPNEISLLFLKEIDNRPNDLCVLGVRLLRHLLDNNLVSEAYEHVLNFQHKSLNEEFTNIQWYETIANVLVRYRRENISTNLSWEYWMLTISTLNNLVMLSLDERSLNIKSTTDCVSAVFNFDQSLKVAFENIKDCPYKQLTQEFLQHYRGQLCFHLSTLIFKLAKANSIKYKEATQMTLPLLFLAYHTSPPETRSVWLDNAPEKIKMRVQRWHREGSFRCSQTGHIIIAAAKDQQKALIEKATMESSGYWHEKLFKKIFVMRDHQSKIASSYFTTSLEFSEPTLRIPEQSEILLYDEYAQTMYPDSLHHYIWIGMNQNLAQFKLSLFDGLQYSVRNLTNCSAESLNILDIQSFIYAAVLCAQSQIDDTRHTIYSNPNKPNLLPAAVSDNLGTLNQSKWLIAAWKMFKNDYRSNFGEMRLTLIKGIEVIRCTGNHGMDVKLLVLLARIFADRTQYLTKQSEIEYNSNRAEVFWKAALPILEKLKNNQVVSYAPNKMFDFKSKEMSLSEILKYIENGKLFMGIQLMKKKEHEKALQTFETLKDPYASFHQAQIYKTLAEEQTNLSKENVTSEMRSQRITLLSHVRDYLYLTLDRLRDPTVDKKHPLNTQIATEIEKIDRLLSRIDPDVSNRNECDGMSDENSSYSSIPDHNFPNISFTNGISPKNETLLRIENSFRREARPSPERLDAQIRQLIASKDTTMHNVLEQNRVMVESHKCLVDELRSFKEVVSNLSYTVNDLRSLKSSVEELKGIKSAVDDLKTSVDELQNFRTVSDMVYEMKKELAELKKDNIKAKNNPLNDEDLYVLEDEYQDYGLPSNINNLNNLYSNIPNRMPGAAAAAAAAVAANSLYGAHPLYQTMGYPVMPYLNYPQANVLPFPPDQQSGLCHVLPQPGLLNSSIFSQGNLNSSGIAQSLIPPALNQHSNIFKDAPGTTPNLYLNPTQPILTTTSILTSPVQSTKIISESASKALPVNVVITSSDPLPTTKVTTPQILSVSIPPQHLKGGSRSQPHNYQIHLPSTGCTTVTAPSVMNQKPLPVTTKTLLANVASPVYSAIPEKHTGLGYQIEKSLTQSFNNSSLYKSDNSTVSIASEEDASPDFKPIIPLPDEVPLTTGEENEEVLFSEYAKLFRFVSKEWRERGVGTIKILHNKTTNKIRILMRRDQVKKICANHFITSDMTLTQMPNSDRAYMWAAQDYADENLVVEKFSVRFKTAMEAQKFYKAFESAKQMSKKSEEVSIPKTPEKPQTTTSLGGFVFTSTPTFKPKDIDQKSENVTQQETAKSSSPFASFTFEKLQSTMPAPTIFASSSTKFGNTTTTTPTTVVFTSTVAKSTAASTTPLFGSTTSNAIFGGSISTNANIATKPTIFNSSPATTLFGNTAQIAVSTPETVKVLGTNQAKVVYKIDGSGDADETHVEDFVPTAEFKPVIPLPELVETKTGEENAEVLYEHKAKLLRYNNDLKEWKERGIGVMKILKQDDKIRFVMRREQVHKVCCNHQLQKGMTFQKMEKNPRAVTWCAEDFSEGEFKRETFAIRFKTEDITNSFLDAVNECLATLNYEDDNKKCDKKSKADNAKVSSSTSPPSKGFGDKFKPKCGSWSCKTCYIVNEVKDNYCVACDTPKNDTVPKKQPESGPQFSFGVKNNIQFNSQNTNDNVAQNSFVFGQKPAATTNFVFGQKSEEDTNASTLTLNFGKTTATVAATAAPVENLVTTTTKSISGFGDTFKPKKGTWECTLCYVRNESDKMNCISCDNPNPNEPIAAKKETKLKGVDLDTHGLTFKFGIQPNNTQITTKTPEPCNITKSEMSFKFGETPTTATTTTTPTINNDNKPLNLTTPTNSPFNFKLNTTTPKPSTETKITDKVEKFVFGSPQQHNFEFTPRSPRRQSGGHGEEESDGSFVEEEDNIYFKPVIPMPDKVDVLTGEESEEVLYCHRAKLFRFRNSEWKERGLGDIKILYNKDSNKLRIVMRREKILKICLNHILTNDIEYIPKEDKSWLFVAADFSEGELEVDKFCLRFKNADVAKQFKEALDKSLKKETSTEAQENIENDSDVEIVSETTVTKEEEEEARRLGLPPKFFAYRQLPDCTCTQCQKEDEMFKAPTEQSKLTTFSFTLPKSDSSTTNNLFSLKSNTILGSPVTTTAPVSSAGNIFGNISGKIFGTPSKSYSGSIFNASANDSNTTGSNIFGSNATDNSSNVSMTEEKTATTDTIVNKPESMFSKPPGTTYSSAFNTTTTSVFGTKPQPFSRGNLIFGNANVETFRDNLALMLGTLEGTEDASKITSTTSNLTEDSELVLKVDSDLSFASLLNKDGPVKFATIKEDDKNPFQSLGAGKPVFGSGVPKPDQNKDKNQSDCETNDATDEYDPHYEPIIPLPEVITVTTGEEEETALFSERTRLYRFDGQEWKERGIGDLKILHHPQKGTYRLLLRREQVHKVVLNQLITADLNMQPMNTSDKAWLWGGHNYAEDEPALEKLAARFKNVTLAKQFYERIQTIVKLLKEEADNKQIPTTVETIGIEEISDTEEHVSEEEEEKYDERSILFARSCLFSEELPSGEWIDIGRREIQLYYDSDFYCSRISVCEDNGLVISNTLIGMNTIMDNDYLTCTWKAVEWADSLFEWRNLRATFDTEEDACEFFASYLESIEYAKHSYILDELPTISSECA